MKVLQAEWIKLKHAPIVWVSFVAFALAPVMGAVFMLIIRDPETLAKAGTFKLKIDAMGIQADWTAYMGILTQAIGVGGILIFGFVVSWLFGREYSEGTAKDLLALPSSRTQIINAKFIIYILWCLALVSSNLAIGLIVGLVLDLPLMEIDLMKLQIVHYYQTTFLTIIIGTPIAYFALKGKGYLAPLGYVALTLVIAQIIAATGFGQYFPWSIPGIYSGISPEYKAALGMGSFLLLGLTCIIGYAATLLYWNKSDQH